MGWVEVGDEQAWPFTGEVKNGAFHWRAVNPDVKPGERWAVRFDVFFFQAEDGIRDTSVTGVQTCALPISLRLARIKTGGAAGASAPLVIQPSIKARSTNDQLPLTSPQRLQRRSRSAIRPRRSEERRVGKECRSRRSRDQRIDKSSLTT